MSSKRSWNQDPVSTLLCMLPYVFPRYFCETELRQAKRVCRAWSTQLAKVIDDPRFRGREEARVQKKLRYLLSVPSQERPNTYDLLDEQLDALNRHMDTEQSEMVPSAPVLATLRCIATLMFVHGARCSPMMITTSP